jgi:hypothetical protein
MEGAEADLEALAWWQNDAEDVAVAARVSEPSVPPLGAGADNGASS